MLNGSIVIVTNEVVVESIPMLVAVSSVGLSIKMILAEREHSSFLSGWLLMNWDQVGYFIVVVNVVISISFKNFSL